MKPADVTVWPTRVAGTMVAHFAIADLSASGVDYRALCRDPAEPNLLLELIPEATPVRWCGACATWAERNGVPLPQVVDEPEGLTG